MRGRERGALLAQIMAGRGRERERGAASSLPGGDLLGGYGVAAPAAAGREQADGGTEQRFCR